jgi:hypothetical protein
MSVIGAIQQGQAARAAGDYNAAIAKQNARWAKQQAGEEERKFRIGARKELGRMRAGYAAAGVTLEGTPTDVLEESAYTAELDALNIRHGGERRAMGFESEAEIEKYKGKVGQRQAYASAAGTLLGAAGKGQFGSLGGGTKTKVPSRIRSNPSWGSSGGRV